jgi:hypothetical protein
MVDVPPMPFEDAYKTVSWAKLRTGSSVPATPLRQTHTDNSRAFGLIMNRATRPSHQHTNLHMTPQLFVKLHHSVEIVHAPPMLFDSKSK